MAEYQEKNDVIESVKQWLNTIIIGLNFCPFAKKSFVNDDINYLVSHESEIEQACQQLIEECFTLQADEDVETSLIIYPQFFSDFEDYLDLVDVANFTLEQAGFSGEFQLASFHPEYCFAGSSVNDASNYTNRSPFPIIHIIREQSIERVLNNYPDPEQIPERNIELARAKGNQFFLDFLQSIKITK